jgi:hypothetical protein
MTSGTRSLVVALSLLTGASAVAQPAPQDSKVDAKALMQSGVRLFEAKDYLGALAVFRDAYRRFPSAKILLNISTTLTLLDRKADAANSYQQYLDSPEADPAKKADVNAVLADLDRVLGRLEITVTPVDAEVQVNDSEWLPASKVSLYRVPEGPFTVRARKDKFQSEATSASLTIGEKAAIRIAMTPLPEETRVIQTPLVTGGAGDTELEVVASSEPPRTRFSGIALVHLDIPHGGAAARVGVGFDVTGSLAVQAAALLGPNSGGYLGATFAFLPGKLRPYAALGLPVFSSNGLRYGMRAGGGLEIEITSHVSVIAEVALEVLMNPEDDILRAVLIPAVGATGRL